MTNDPLEYAKYIQEWWKVGVSILTPIAIAVLTFFVTRALNQREALFRRGEQVLSMKQDAYARIGPKINIIYIFVSDFGDYRNYTPDDVIRLKREVDREFFMFSPFWSQATASAYRLFMDACFETYVGSGKNARIRSTCVVKKSACQLDGKAWNPNWDEMFSPAGDRSVHQKYHNLVAGFVGDITSRDLEA